MRLRRPPDWQTTQADEEEPSPATFEELASRPVTAGD